MKWQYQRQWRSLPLGLTVSSSLKSFCKPRRSPRMMTSLQTDRAAWSGTTGVNFRQIGFRAGAVPASTTRWTHSPYIDPLLVPHYPGWCFLNQPLGVCHLPLDVSGDLRSFQDVEGASVSRVCWLMFAADRRYLPWFHFYTFIQRHFPHQNWRKTQDWTAEEEWEQRLSVLTRYQPNCRIQFL